MAPGLALAIWGAQVTVPIFLAPLDLSGDILSGDILFAEQRAIATELRQIQQRGYLIVGVKENVPPLGSRTVAGELEGFEIDLARRLATDLLGDGAAVELKPLANPDRLPALLAGEVDLLIAQVTQTADRDRLVTFSPPYYLSGMQVITLQPELNRLAALRDQRLGVLVGSDAGAIALARLPRLTLVPYDSYRAAQAGLRQGDIDAFLGDAAILTGWQQAQPELLSVGPLLSVDTLAIALPKGLQHEPLRQKVEAIVRQWQQSGWLQNRQQHWGLP